MKFLVIFAHLFFIPKHQTIDSVNLRIYNTSKYLVSKYSININQHDYIFENIKSKGYSTYQKVPFIFANGSYDITIVKKSFLRRPYTLRCLAVEVDQLGDEKLKSGSAVINLNIKIHHNKLEPESNLQKE